MGASSQWDPRDPQPAHAFAHRRSQQLERDQIKEQTKIAARANEIKNKQYELYLQQSNGEFGNAARELPEGMRPPAVAAQSSAPGRLSTTKPRKKRVSKSAKEPERSTMSYTAPEALADRPASVAEPILESWRAFATERGQTARVAKRSEEVLKLIIEKKYNTSKGKNTLFFGSGGMPKSEYQEKLDGGVEMDRHMRRASVKLDGAPDTARRRMAAMNDWGTVAALTQKGGSETLLQRLRSSANHGSSFAEQEERRKQERRKTRDTRLAQREGQVQGLYANYAEDQPMSRHDQFKLLRGMRSQRDSLTPAGRMPCYGAPGLAQQPLGQTAANKSLLWGVGNEQMKGFRTDGDEAFDSSIIKGVAEEIALGYPNGGRE